MAPSLCPDCISGVRHEGTILIAYPFKNKVKQTLCIGTPTGKVEQINGVDVYVTIPSGEYAKDKALLYIPGEDACRVLTITNPYNIILQMPWDCPFPMHRYAYAPRQ